VIALLDAAGASVTFVAVWCVWQARRAWLHGHRAAPRIIRGEIEREDPGPQ
jgi:hypothetical protein